VTVVLLRRTAVVLAATVMVGSVAGCSRTTGSPNESVPSVASDLAAVVVAGDPGAKPSLRFPTPFSVTTSQRRILTEGDGDVVDPGERVSVDYVGINATDGTEFETTFGEKPRSFVLDSAVIVGISDGLSGLPVGSRVLLAVTPDDGYGVQGVPAAGIGPADTLLFVVEIKSASKLLKRAEGKTVKPKPGLPRVKLDKSGAPTISIPTGKPPASLVVQPLITGAGDKVVKGQTITVHYTGVIWDGGKSFDSSWARKAPAQFGIGVGEVIAGWDEGLIGRTVGSQVLLVIPPDDGYGVEGKPAAGIKGTDTLVFVVDILDAAA
jgi:peptidylprolyl isomerase